MAKKTDRMVDHINVTNSLHRFSIKQFFATCVAIAAILALFREYHAEKKVWRTNLLSYAVPKVPQEFYETRKGIVYYSTPGILIEWPVYKDAPSMFMREHRKGWEMRRHGFIEDYVNQRIKAPSTAWLSIEDWNGHINYAETSGYQKCTEQIEELQKTHDRNELKEQLYYSRNWHINTLWAIFFIAIVAFLWFRPKRKPGNAVASY